MTRRFIEMHSNKIATHFQDCIANLQKCVAFSDMTHGKLNPASIQSLHFYKLL